MIVCDTDPLVAASDRDDDHNRACAIVDLQLADYARMADLVETYADFPLGTAARALYTARLVTFSDGPAMGRADATVSSGGWIVAISHRTPR